MKHFSYKQIFAKRRCLLYFAMVLFACYMINYEHLSNVLQVSIARWKTGSAKSSRDETINLLLKGDSKMYRRRRQGDVNTNSLELYKRNVGPSIPEFKNIDSSIEKDINLDNLINKITTNIIETFDDNTTNVSKSSFQTCSTTTAIGNSCKIGNCLQMELSSDLRTRIEQLVAPSHLQMNSRLRRLLSVMADKVPGNYDFILVSAVSYSHFEEAQAMLYNIHTHLFPYLKNFTFIYYNLGLSYEQRMFMAKVCRCHLIDFPFNLLPEFIGFLKCYAWKPLIVNAHISRSKFIFWVDSSVRFKKHSYRIMDLLNRAEHRGIQVFGSKQPIARVTLPSLFHFFGDEACVYANVSVILSGVVLFHNELFVKRAILEPWAACAMNTDCMCPENINLKEIRISCHNETATNYYGTCHRFDQSAISLILVKIYQDQMDNILAPINDYLDIKRADRMKYPIEGVINSN